jgi:hypothetical protein
MPLARPFVRIAGWEFRFRTSGIVFSADSGSVEWKESEPDRRILCVGSRLIGIF